MTTYDTTLRKNGLCDDQQCFSRFSRMSFFSSSRLMKIHATCNRTLLSTWASIRVLTSVRTLCRSLILSLLLVAIKQSYAYATHRDVSTTLVCQHCFCIRTMALRFTASPPSSCFFGSRSAICPFGSYCREGTLSYTYLDGGILLFDFRILQQA